MNKNALLWIALGGIGVYLLMRKKTQATTQGSGDVQGGGIITPTPTPNDVKEKIYLGGLGVSPARMTDDELKNFYVNKYCKSRTQKVKLSEEELAFRESALREIAKRGLKFDCSGKAVINPKSQDDCPPNTRFIILNQPCQPGGECKSFTYCMDTRNDGINPKLPLARLLEQRIPTGIK